MIQRLRTPWNDILYYMADPVPPATAGVPTYATVWTQPLFQQLTEIESQQDRAVVTNINAEATYRNELATYQTTLNAGRLTVTAPPLVIPQKPNYVIVADAPGPDGNPVITEIPWPGGLPDVVQPNVFTSSAAVTALAWGKAHPNDPTATR